RTAPVWGSKYSWLMFPQFGQGILTLATPLVPSARPLPAQWSVTPMSCRHEQQAKSKITSSSIIQESLQNWEQSKSAVRSSSDRSLGNVLDRDLGGGAARGLPTSLLAFLLGAVLASCLLAIGHALRIEDAANDVVADAGQVADATAAHKHDGVLLQVMPFARDISSDLDAVGEADAGHFA